jgi:hypothetical protein
MKLQTESAETTYSMYPFEGFWVYVTAWRDAFCSLKGRRKKSDQVALRNVKKTNTYFEMPTRYESLAYYVPQTTSKDLFRSHPWRDMEHLMHL